MIDFVIYAPSGQILAAGRRRKNGGLPIKVAGTVLTLPDPVDIDPSLHYVEVGALVAMPARAHPHLTFDYASKAWVDARTQAELDSATDRAWARLRFDRAQRLSASDWTVLPDAPVTQAQRAAWEAYRQALRDLPATTQDPASPVWPTPPE